jgi:hypothetical protein
MYHKLGNHFVSTRWYSYVTWVKWKLILAHLEIVLLSAQDRCMVCVESTTARKSFWTHPMILVGAMGQVEAHFGSFRDSFNLSAC